MRGLIVSSRPVYTLIWTAEDWDLYTDMDGVEDVARDLDDTFNRLVNAGVKENTLRSCMYDKLNEYRSYGADDTEPRANLEILLHKIFRRDAQ